MDATEMHLAAYERSLKAKNRSIRTIQGYLEALGQLAEHSGTGDIAELDQAAIEEWIAAVIARPKRVKAHGHANSTAAIRFRQVRAFFSWAVQEEIIDVSPMRRMTEPSTVDVPVPVLTDDQLRTLIKACEGKGFEDRRDTAIIRLWCEPGSPRVAEMASLCVGDLDLREGMVTMLGKGGKIRVIPYGAKTGQAIDRYLRVRSKHRNRDLSALWLGARALKPITSSGLEQMLRRRAERAGIGHVHPHQLRHTSYHAYEAAGGGQGSAMRLFGWSSAEMPLHYGKSARDERARAESRRLSPADRL